MKRSRGGLETVVADAGGPRVRIRLPPAASHRKDKASTNEPSSPALFHARGRWAMPCPRPRAMEAAGFSRGVRSHSLLAVGELAPRRALPLRHDIGTGVRYCAGNPPPTFSSAKPNLTTPVASQRATLFYLHERRSCGATVERAELSDPNARSRRCAGWPAGRDRHCPRKRSAGSSWVAGHEDKPSSRWILGLWPMSDLR
jgi:hypothetical protein